MTTVIFRSYRHREGIPYDPCFGVYQADNGDLICLARIPASPIADRFFENLASVPASAVSDYDPLLAAIREMGVNVSPGQRLRRKGKKQAAESGDSPSAPETPGPETSPDPSAGIEPVGNSGLSEETVADGSEVQIQEREKECSQPM